MRFWLDPHIGHRILTFHSQRKSNAFPAHFPRISRALKTHFTLCFAHAGVWAETGLTATGHAWEMRGKCVCLVICLCLLSVLYGFSVFFHFVKWATYTNMCYKCMGNEILAGPSHRSSDTHISFSTEKQCISRALARALKTHFTLCFAHSGVWAETGLTATGHAWEMRGKCAGNAFV